jgi:hypothetical protein
MGLLYLIYGTVGAKIMVHFAEKCYLGELVLFTSVLSIQIMIPDLHHLPNLDRASDLTEIIFRENS